MYLAHFTEPTPLLDTRIAPGDYLVEDVNAGEFLAGDFCRVSEAPGGLLTPFDPALDWNGRKVLFIRPGGFGDLLFLTPVFAELKRRWPGIVTEVACFPGYAPALQGNPDVDRIAAYPVPLSGLGGYGAHVWLENIIEKNPEARHLHAVDLLAKRVGVAPADKRLRYVPTPGELAAANAAFPKSARKRVGIQVAASSPVRSYPPRLTREVGLELHKKGWEIFMFGSPGQLQTDLKFVNLTQRRPPVLFRESAAILTTCDVCIAPDSALVHLAGALDVPTVALYGSFPWPLRTAYAPSITALTGKLPCAPCFHHQRRNRVFPEGGPCNQSGECDALAQIDPARIAAKAEALAR